MQEDRRPTDCTFTDDHTPELTHYNFAEWKHKPCSHCGAPAPEVVQARAVWIPGRAYRYIPQCEPCSDAPAYHENPESID